MRRIREAFQYPIERFNTPWICYCRLQLFDSHNFVNNVSYTCMFYTDGRCIPLTNEVSSTGANCDQSYFCFRSPAKLIAFFPSRR